MTFKAIGFVGTVALSMIASTAVAECTPEYMQEKTAELTTGMQTLAATDPVKMQELATKMQESMVAAQTSGDPEAICAAFDELLAELG